VRDRVRVSVNASFNNLSIFVFIDVKVVKFVCNFDVKQTNPSSTQFSVYT
jgi:hypothetical protein